MEINSQTIIDSNANIEIMVNIIKNCVDNIKKDMEIFNNNTSKRVVSSVGLEKSCNEVINAGKGCLMYGDIMGDIARVFDSINEEEKTRRVA